MRLNHHKTKEVETYFRQCVSVENKVLAIDVEMQRSRDLLEDVKNHTLNMAKIWRVVDQNQAKMD